MRNFKSQPPYLIDDYSFVISCMSQRIRSIGYSNSSMHRWRTVSKSVNMYMEGHID